MNMFAVRLHVGLQKAVKTSPARLVATREDEDTVSWALAGRG